MISIRGQLAIRTINGRNGAFNVGRLASSIGEFSIKNAELEQYAEGKYDGDFVLERIYPTSYVASGRMVIEIRAQLAGMSISSVDHLSLEDAKQLAPQEQDPLDEDDRTARATRARTSSAAAMPKDEAPAKDGSVATVGETGDEALFSTLWPLGVVVKLDSTVERLMLRQQSNRLNELGYRFEPLSQDWHLTAA
ncbi:DUF3275 family protein [Pseudomonas chlororaphis]|uniref:DUF3275 family protein n=1 Tax=Pseudomonas chlororaphis TaxID=587753 RepID=UPI0004721D91|nr:DUF3275 family protein [Pseudomonas chlororaphis]